MKAHRNGAWRAYRDPATTLDWLVPPYRAFGRRLGCVLYRIPEREKRDVGRLDDLLAAWPRDVPIALDLEDPSWLDDAVLDRMTRFGAALCSTDRDGAPLPLVQATSGFLYLRLRRSDYSAAELDAWAARVAPFLEDGRDAFVFFRHDAVGRAAELALQLVDKLAAADVPG